MSDQDVGKRMIERYHLDLFLTAQEHVTGRPLELVGGGESPDFVVRRPSGFRAGLELVQVFHDAPNSWVQDHDRNWERPARAAWAVQETIGWKAQKLRQPHWRYKLQTILVVTLMDVVLAEAAPHFHPSLQREFGLYGFVEIWVAEMTEEALDAFGGDIDLFGLHPKKWWGYHRRRRPYRKPHG